jgi:hypothetical protein
MKYVLIVASAVAITCSVSALSVAQEYDRSFVSEVSEEVCEHQQVCIDRIAEEWSKPAIADENFTKLTLTMVLNRLQNGQESVLFYGTTFNRFLQLERKTTITSRITDKPPYPISFRMAR